MRAAIDAHAPGPRPDVGTIVGAVGELANAAPGAPRPPGGPRRRRVR
jgi:hypothetical protein